MAMDEVRARYLRDRVLTATPAQRVVMLYQRLSLDLNLAQAAAETDAYAAGAHLSHAMQIVAELQSSLNTNIGGPAENLSSIYAYLLNELLTVRGGDIGPLSGLREIVATLTEAWSRAAEQITSDGPAAAAGAWVG